MTTEKRITFDSLPFAGLDRMGGHIGFHSRRQQMIAANLANIDTPGYRSRDLAFHERITARLEGEHPTRVMTHGEESLTVDDEVPDQDGNSVSLEHQMARGAANNLRYRSLSELLSRQIGMLRYASSDGQGG